MNDAARADAYLVNPNSPLEMIHWERSSKAGVAHTPLVFGIG